MRNEIAEIYGKRRYGFAYEGIEQRREALNFADQILALFASNRDVPEIRIDLGNKHYKIGVANYKNRHLEEIFLDALYRFHTDYSTLFEQSIKNKKLISKLRANLPPEYWHLFKEE